MRDQQYNYRNVRREPECSRTAPMALGLSCAGKIWAALSCLGMGLSCVGFFVPFWLEGNMETNNTATYLGVWRRCNYLTAGERDVVEIVYECGRYSTFMDIPCVWWQVTTVVIGVGCGLTILVAFAALFGCCVKDVITRTTAKVARCMQFLAALCIGAGCVFYPLGWDSPEVKQVCGDTADKFHLGSCHLQWAFYVTAIGAGLLLICVFLSCCAVREYTPRYRKHKQQTRTCTL